jgi:thymidylate synthase (FAD)
MKYKQTLPKVELLHHTPISIMDKAVGTCWDKHKDEIDLERLDRVVNKFKHQSISEHVTFNFYISNISRSLFQELVRHRLASISVKSTRYTLKELKEETPFITYDNYPHHCVPEYLYEKASKYLVFTKNVLVDKASIQALEDLRQIITSGVTNDIAKYCLPESYKTELTWTINVRSLKNFLKLRTDKAALWEIRNLAYTIFNNIPGEFKFLFIDELYKDDNHMLLQITEEENNSDE